MPTQRSLTQAEYITLADPLAKAAGYLLTAAGDEDTSGTAAYQARLARDIVVAFDQPDEYGITVDLAEPLGNIVDALPVESALVSYFSQFNSAMNHHLNGADIGAWLTTGAVRVHSLFKRCVNRSIPAVNCFPPIMTLGTVAVTGSGAGTFTVGTPVDTTLYGGAQVAVKVVNQAIGIANVGVSVTGLDSTGATRTWTGTIPAESASGTIVNLAGTGVTDGVSASACAVTLGTAGDDFEIVTVEDRTL